MIPVRLRLSGFISYREPVEIDFSNFDLACISGQNGAGKSSLLDAITWVLFGEARRRDDAVINGAVDTAEVILDFEYEGALYRVQRAKPRGKTGILEFHIRGETGWRPLTEATMRATQERIGHTLRMDYGTFINASFFLQGKADQFAQQSPGERKRILSSILGLEIWETFRDQAAQRRRQQEQTQSNLIARLREIETDLSEEQSRRAHLSQLEESHLQKVQLRDARNQLLTSNQQKALLIEEQRSSSKRLKDQLTGTQQRFSLTEQRLQQRLLTRDQHATILARADEIEKNYQKLQTTRQELDHWQELAAQHHTLINECQKPERIIQATASRLEQERDSLRANQVKIDTQSKKIPLLEREMAKFNLELESIQNRLLESESINAELAALREQLGRINAENQRLTEEIADTQEIINQLSEVEGGLCPLCSSELTDEKREQLLTQHKTEVKTFQDKIKQNNIALEDIINRQKDHNRQLAELKSLDASRQNLQTRVKDYVVQLAALKHEADTWETISAGRLAEVEGLLTSGEYSQTERAQLADLKQRIKALGYDEQAHMSVRRLEQELRSSEQAFQDLKKSASVIETLEQEIENLQQTLAADRELLATQMAEYERQLALIEESAADLPDLLALEREVNDLRVEVNKLLTEIGQALQRVKFIEQQHANKERFSSDLANVRLQIARLQKLERAFSKDGVPALLIEQALPDIETQANEFLDRLSNGTMSVRFETQRQYKDKTRDDKKETLDILISDPGGTREYEMFSGGEAFRVNFAIRLALSRTLARRAGARLQTLVIDEGFGSQDNQGRQRLVEAINLVRSDFAKILVITHLEELKDAFPTRIEVEKSPTGSSVRVLTS